MPKRISIDEKEPDVATSTPVSESEATPLPESRPVIKENQSMSLTGVDAEMEKKSGGSLSAFMVHPPGIFFVDKTPEEELLLLLRAHVITNVPWIIVTVLLMLAPAVLFPIFFGLNFLPTPPIGLSLVLTIFWYLVTFSYAFINFLYWYFNVYIVTNERVIDVDWYSIIYRKVSSTQIAKIQDASASQGGVLAGIFDFGDVQIQTAGTEENFEFANVPHPQLVAKKIEELMQKEEIENEGQSSP